MKNTLTYRQLMSLKEGKMQDTTTQAVAVIDREPTTPMSLIQAAVQSNADPDRLEKLFALQERYERNRAASDFAQALAKFQANCPPIHKGRAGAHGAKFAGFDDIMAKIRPVLAECGLSVSFDTEHTDGKSITCFCIVKHGIHEHRTKFTCPVATDLKANDSQKYGSALSYVKRYSLSAALNLVVTDEDDDGNSGGGSTISDEQRAEIESLVAAKGTNLEKFLAWCEGSDLASMPVSFYPKAIDYLKRLPDPPKAPAAGEAKPRYALIVARWQKLNPAKSKDTTAFYMWAENRGGQKVSKAADLTAETMERLEVVLDEMEAA